MYAQTLESFLESRIVETQGKMQAPKLGDCIRLLEFEEENNRLGADFFRLFAGVSSRHEADSLSQDAIDGFLSVTAYSLGKALAMRKSLAGKPTPRNLTRHIENAFPLQLAKVGTTLRKGSGTAKPSKVFEGCPSSEASCDLEDGTTWSFRLSWKVRTPVDISDPTEVTELAMGGEGAHLEPSGEVFKPRQVGFTPRDSGYTPEELVNHGLAAYARGWRNAINAVYGYPVDWADVPVSHTGLTLGEIDAVLLAYDTSEAATSQVAPNKPRQARKPRQSRKQASTA